MAIDHPGLPSVKIPVKSESLLTSDISFRLNKGVIFSLFTCSLAVSLQPVPFGMESKAPLQWPYSCGRGPKEVLPYRVLASLLPGPCHKVWL